MNEGSTRIPNGASWFGDFHGTLAYLIGYVGSCYSIRDDSNNVSNITGLQQLRMCARNINHCLEFVIT